MIEKRRIVAVQKIWPQVEGSRDWWLFARWYFHVLSLVVRSCDRSIRQIQWLFFSTVMVAYKPLILTKCSKMENHATFEVFSNLTHVNFTVYICIMPIYRPMIEIPIPTHFSLKWTSTTISVSILLGFLPSITNTWKVNSHSHIKRLWKPTEIHWTNREWRVCFWVQLAVTRVWAEPLLSWWFTGT